MRTIDVQIDEHQLSFVTAESLFSPRWIDKGTRAMLSQVQFSKDDVVLDLGCGYGIVGILAAKHMDPSRVWLIDVDPVAVDLSRENARRNHVEGVNVLLSDGFASLDASGFSLILSNPPYQVDFSVPKHFIEKGFNRLRMGGRLYMVTKRRLWYKNKLIAVFGGVQILEVGEYHVFCAVRKTLHYTNGLIRRRKG